MIYTEKNHGKTLDVVFEGGPAVDGNINNWMKTLLIYKDENEESHTYLCREFSRDSNGNARAKFTYIVETSKPQKNDNGETMKPFDLEAAKRGEPIVTRGGRKAKFVAHVPEAREDQQVLLLVEDGLLRSCNLGGHGFNEIFFMAPPPMRSINGHEYPEPVREPLEEGQEYFLPAAFHDEIVSRSKWGSDHMDDRWLKRGLIHLTREAAEAHARAIILAGGGDV